VASATITATTAQMFAAQEPKIESANRAATSVRSGFASAQNALGWPATTAVRAYASWPAVAGATDRWRNWLWGFLAILCLSQSYFVLELVAVFALFLLAFGAIAALVLAGYLLQKGWDFAAAKLAMARQPVLQISPVTPDTRKPA
jgi:hypothetical protein